MRNVKVILLLIVVSMSLTACLGSGGGSAAAAPSATTYSVNISLDTNTAASPNSTQTVPVGATQAFTVTANVNFTLSSSVGGTCPAGSWNGNTYSTGAIVGDCSVSFSSAIASYTIPPSGDGHTSFSPNSNQIVAYGGTQAFTVTANAGYTRSSTVGGSCPAGSWSGAIYTTGPITSDCSVSFSSISNSTTYSVNISLDAHTTANPSSTQTVLVGSTQAFTLTANSNFTLSNSIGGTCPAGSWTGNVYTTGPIFGNCTVSFSSAIDTFAVTPSVDGNTTSTPNTAQTVAFDSTQSFTVSASTGYTLSTSVGGNCPAGSWAGNTYTTGLITAVCAISFSSTVNSYTVGGTVSGLSGTLVLQDNGGDNLSVTSNGSFTFSTSVAFGTPYTVSILTQPSGQICTVTSPSGTMSTANVTSVALSCLSFWGGTVQDGTSGGTASAQALGVAADPSRNVYVVGKTTGAIDGQAKHGNQDLFIAKYNTSGTRQWTIEDGVSSKSAVAYAVATDSGGNVYATGCATGAIDGQTLSGTADLIITKYSPSGVHQWTVQDGVSGSQVCGSGIATDASGNVYVTGSTNAAFDSQAQHGANDFFITKYNSSGIRQWTIQDGATGAASVFVYGIAVDSGGNAFLTGSGAAFDGQSGDFFITKYSSSGLRQWTIQDGNATGQGIAVDSTGNVIVAGITSVSFDGQTLHGAQDFFITKYNTSGTRQWTVQDGVSGGTVAAWGVAVDGSGNVFATGVAAGVALDGQTKYGFTDLFVTKYSSSGTRQWTVQDGATGSSVGVAGIAVDSSGYAYAVGDVTGAAIDGQTQHGSEDFFATQYSPLGVHE